MGADQNLLVLKNEVLLEVAQLAFEGKLDQYDEIPEKMIPGPAPKFRCCIYKEREIIRQRVRLAMDKPAGLEKGDHGSVMQVIYAACADCPISSYTVTENCQNCLGKACINACKFGAITIGSHRSHIDASKCKECGACANACPYNAIAHLQRPCKKICPVDAITYDEYGITQIDDKKCIRCGHCIHSCPFGAIDSRKQMIKVIDAIKSDQKVYVMIAPAVEGQDGPDITMASWKKAMKEVGFTDMIEVALGADMTTVYEAEEWAEAYAKKEKKTTSCCPAFVNMIRKHYPTVAPLISTTVSPMCALSRYIKSQEPDAITVFVGPCVAKKSEAYEFGIENNADYVLTFSEIQAMMKAKGVQLEKVDEVYQEGSKYAKRFANAGGVTAAVLQSLKEKDVEFNAKVYKASGPFDVKKGLLQLNFKRLPEQFMEGMMCEGGCVNGPCSYTPVLKAKKTRDALINNADDREVNKNLQAFDMTNMSMHHHQ